MERVLSLFDPPYLRLNTDTGNTFIAGCIEWLKHTRWDGVLSTECEAAPGKMEQSVEWLRNEIVR